jgi:hypothetical protein
MKKKRYPISPEHIAQFKVDLAHWQTRLNLNNWRIEFKPEQFAKAGDMADATYWIDDRCASVRLGKWWSTEPTAKEISRTALHEVLHILLEELVVAAQSKDKTMVLSAEHGIIVLLERVLIPDA